MKYTTLILFVITVVALAGCEAQNPVCTENFCAVGEIFPRSELSTREQYIELNGIDDAKLVTYLTGAEVEARTPTEPVEVFNPNVSVGTLVKSAKDGSTLYKGKTVNIRAEIKRFDTIFVYVKTYTSVTFRISMRNHPDLHATIKDAIVTHIKDLDNPHKNVPEVIRFDLTIRITEIIPSRISAVPI